MAVARKLRLGLFDKLNPSAIGLTDDERDSASRQGLLALASGLLGTGGGFGNALGAGIQGGLLAMNQGANGIVNDKYRQAMMQRTMAGMDRNTQLEQLASELVSPTGEIDEINFKQYAVRDPQNAKALREAIEGPKTRWQMGQIGDGSGGTIDVLFDPNDPSNIRTIDGQPIGPGAQQTQGPTGGAASLLGDAASSAAQVAPDMGLLSQAVMQQESGGDPNAVSSAGARGLMQLMPGTQRDPGFGVQPARDDSPQENMRMGQDYLQAMLSRYGGNQQLALAAYNAGPGRVDQALQATGGSPEKAIATLPAETRNYVPSVQKRLSGVPAGAPMIGRRPAKTGAGKNAPSGYQWGPDGQSLTPIKGGPAQVAMDARADAADARKFAEEVMNTQKMQAAQARQTEAANASNQLVAAIDSLTASSGFGELGTAMGDVKINTPLIRSDVKDAQAQLKNIAGQVALTTMAKLKALSSAGATGFGALSAPELKLLENSIAALQSEDISNAQLKSSLKTIRDKMDKTASWNPAQGASPQPAAPAGGGSQPRASSKYMKGQVVTVNGKQYKVVGGDPSDPELEEVL